MGWLFGSKKKDDKDKGKVPPIQSGMTAINAPSDFEHIYNEDNKISAKNTAKSTKQVADDEATALIAPTGFERVYKANDSKKPPPSAPISAPRQISVPKQASTPKPISKPASIKPSTSGKVISGIGASDAGIPSNRHNSASPASRKPSVPQNDAATELIMPTGFHRVYKAPSGNASNSSKQKPSQSPPSDEATALMAPTGFVHAYKQTGGGTSNQTEPNKNVDDTATALMQPTGFQRIYKAPGAGAQSQNAPAADTDTALVAPTGFQHAYKATSESKSTNTPKPASVVPNTDLRRRTSTRYNSRSGSAAGPSGARSFREVSPEGLSPEVEDAVRAVIDRMSRKVAPPDIDDRETIFAPAPSRDNRTRHRGVSGGRAHR